MSNLKISPVGCQEVIEIYLDPVKHPVAYNTKVEELIGSGMTREEAEGFVQTTPFEMELYYSKNQGLFMVESEVIESADIYNPYDGKVVYNPDNN